MKVQKNTLITTLIWFGLMSLAVLEWGCGVSSFVGGAEHLDSLYSSSSVIKPQYRIFTADTARIRERYEALKAEYTQKMDSIKELVSNDPNFDTERVVLPTDPDSSIHIDVLFIDDSYWPDSVTVGVKVYNHLGESIIGLAPPYISHDEALEKYWREVTDLSDEKECSPNPRIIEPFSVTEIRKNQAPNHAITYVLDYSGSMGGNRDLFEKLIRKMVISSRSGDMFSFVPFAGTSHIAQPMTYDLAKVKSLFDNKYYLDSIESGTAILPALEEAIIETSKANDSLTKAIMLLTDGFDGFSDYEEKSTLAKASSNNIKIYAISYGLGNNSSLLKKYAEDTGGRYYLVTNPAEFKFAFADMYLDLSAFYKITFKPNQCRGHHNVSIDLLLDNLDNMKLSADAEYRRAILPKKEPGVTVTYLDILFETGSAEIDTSSNEIIKQLATELKKRRDIRIEVIGHTDNIGSEEDNQKLSEERAEAVMESLIEFGIRRRDISYKGEGEINAVATNATPEGRAKNRRTELKITAK